MFTSHSSGPVTCIWEQIHGEGPRCSSVHFSTMSFTQYTLRNRYHDSNVCLGTKCKHFPCVCVCVCVWGGGGGGGGGVHRPPVDSPHKVQWRGALMFSLTCTRTNGWANDRDAGDLRCHRVDYDITVMFTPTWVDRRIYGWLNPWIHTCS